MAHPYSSRAGTVAAAVTLAGLAGVLLPAAHAQIVGPNVNTNGATGLTDGQEEPAIVINRANPNNIVVLSNDDTVNVGMGLYESVTFDGGHTWSSGVALPPGSPSTPGAFCDPSLASDTYGNIFAGYLDGKLDSSNPSGVDTNPVVAISTNGGLSFNTSVALPLGGYCDQPTFVVGPGTTPGSQVLWVSAENTSTGDMFVASAPILGLGSIGAFSALTVLNDTTGNPLSGGNFGDIAVGPNGKVAVAYQNSNTAAGPDTILVNVSTDGGATFGNGVAATTTNVGGFRPIPPQDQRTVDSEAGLAWDHSGDAHNGRLYMIYTDAADTTTNATQIFERYSDDNGLTWSAPIAVGETTGSSQFLPRLSLDQTTGDLAVTWYDSRNDPTGNGAQYFGAISLDGGQTFSPDFQIATGLSNFNSSTGYYGPSVMQYGDYSALDGYGGVWHAAWIDNSNSTGDNPNGGLSAGNVYTDSVAAAPEPGSLALMAVAGLSGAAFLVRRRRGGK